MTNCGASVYNYWVWYASLQDEARLEEVIAWCSRVPVNTLVVLNGSFDADPAFLSLEQHVERAHYLEGVIPRLAEVCSGVGINVLSTMGHGNKIARLEADFGFQPILGSDGEPATGGACPLDESFLTYAANVFRAYARTGAGQIWADDDVRIANHGQRDDYCFCPLHLRQLSRKTGREWEIGTLVEVLSEPDELEIHGQWREVNSTSIEQLFARIEEAVHSIAPEARLGMMSCGANLGRDVDRELRALTGGRALPLLRPGGGFLQDGDLYGALRKQILMRSEWPGGSQRFTSFRELDHYPYSPHLKALGTKRLEMDLSFLDGHDGVIINTASSVSGSVDDSEDLVALLRHRHDLYLSLREAVRGKRPIGLRVMRNPDRSLTEGLMRWTENNPGFRRWGEALSRYGIPTVSHCPDSGDGPSVLCDGICDGLDRSSLEGILQKGAVIEAQALSRLVEEGFLDGDVELSGDEADVRDIAWEELSEVSYNGRFAGNRIEAFGLPRCREIVTRGDRCTVLAEYHCTDGRTVPSLILLHGEAPSLAIPYSLSEGAFSLGTFEMDETTLLCPERAFQLARFLSMSPGYAGIWARDVNCFPIVHDGGGATVVGIARFSLDLLSEHAMWLAPRCGKPAGTVEVLAEAGEWEAVDYDLQADAEMGVGHSLRIGKAGRAMEVNVFRWENAATG